MLVKELITRLETVDGDARVFMGYDGNVVVTEPDEVVLVTDEEEMPICWYSVESGDVVILCAE